ncbi:MAG: sensor domain-containing diguanylate cyclase [Rhodocyclales bacterium]|nr:sensor domain-containing diguanylate cyclase [Rhodocyclales bacterium]
MQLILAGLFVLAMLGWWLAWRWKARADDLAEQEERSRAYARMSSDWYWEQDKHMRFIWLSGGVFDKAGVNPERFYGHTRLDMLAGGISEETAALFAAHQQVLDARQPFHDFEYPIVSVNGEISHVSVNGEPVFDRRGRFAGYRGTGKDITERCRIEATMRHMAQCDGLTGLPNRKLFYDRLGHALEFARRGGSTLAVLYFDLDRFKPVNDRWGHEAGDLLLKSVAVRVQEIVRESDTIARLGGDEFSVLLQDIGARSNAERVAGKIRNALALPFALATVSGEVLIGASIGIAYYPDDAQNGDELIRLADAGMYVDKEARHHADDTG